jgi:hypothetical protein
LASNPLVTGAGLDFVQGSFASTVKDARALAERIHAFCPDFVEQGLGLQDDGPPHELIVRHFQEDRSFFLWWH